MRLDHHIPATCLGLALALSPALCGAEWYVSANLGKGKAGTKAEPAKDLGNIISQLQAGDTVHIAQGVYYGKGKSGCDVIEVPVKIIAGYSDDFSKRDPWGEHRTVFSGANFDNPNFVARARLLIELHLKYQTATKPEEKNQVLVDGLIVDNAERNQYLDDKQLKIRRDAVPAEKKSQTPNTPGIKVTLGKFCDATVQNCVVLNCAIESADGAISVGGGKASKIAIRNNLVVNNTGNGIFPMALVKPNTKTPKWEDFASATVENNTVLFCWKPGPIDEYSGSGMRIDDGITVVAKGNVFAFNDVFAVDNINKGRLTLIDNLVTANRKADYRDFNTQMKISAIDDEAEHLGKDTKGNVNQPITVPVPAEWSAIWAGRPETSRAEVDAQVKADNSSVNALRSMLGLPLQGGAVADAGKVWLHRIPLDGALKAGTEPYLGKYGCKKP